MNAPVFAHGQMRLYLLRLLEDGPKHGYELIQAIERRFNGAYVPSAGTIYPRLAKLADEGLVTRHAEGRKSIYAITDAGRAELERRRDETELLEDEIESSVRQLADSLRADLRGSFDALKDELGGGGRHGPPRQRGRRPQAAGSRPRSTPDAFGPTDGQGDARTPIREAEQAIYRFGLDLRNTLRSADAAGTLTEDIVTDLGHELDDLLTRTRARF